jgi:ubiquinone/menaquinone biosynthesis C-methylase UbiE
MATDALARLFPERHVVNFIHRQDRVVFFSMVNELVEPDAVVLDFGAGRGRQAEIGGRHLKSISIFQGRCKKLIGVDVDPAVLENPVIDEAHVVGIGEKMPLADASVDIIYSYAVFEHVANPEFVAAELMRVLKPGGWICAWTPNKWGYVSMGARLVPNRLHAKFLEAIQPGGRDEKDVFPTVYKMNTKRALSKLFPGMENHSFGFNAQPSYNFGSALISRFWMLYMSLTPRSMAQSLMIFLRKTNA